jgi:hypothetical protein
MGLIDKAVKYGLKKVPLTTAIRNIPATKVIDLAYKTLKYSYKTAKWADNKWDFSGRWAKNHLEKHGPASKGLIDVADKGEQLYNKGKGYYDKGKGYVDKATKWGEKQLDKGIKKVFGGDKPLPQNPSPKTQPPKVMPSHSTPFPKSTQNSIKSPTLNLPDIPNYKLRKPGLSLKIKSYQRPLNLGSHKSKVNLRALANHKLFTIKTKANTAKFNPPKSNASTLRSKMSFMPKLNTPKLKLSSMNSRPVSKSPLTTRTPFKLPSTVRRSPISKPAMKIGPFKR